MRHPRPIQNVLKTRLVDAKHPAWLKSDSSGILLEAGGALEWYDLCDLVLGTPLPDRLTFLKELVTIDSATDLPMVEFGSVMADIHLLPQNGNLWIVFLDSSEQAGLQRLLVQKANDLRLIQEQQVKLMTELEFTNAQIFKMNEELDERVRQRTEELREANDQLRAEMAERQNAENQLRQAQKMEAIGQLAGGIAHDFNNMMTVVIGYGEMLLWKFGAQQKLREMVEQILQAGEMAAGIARQLLAFSRRAIVQDTAVQINTEIKTLEKMLVRLIGSNIRLEKNLCEDPFIVWIDPGQIEQVILNLIVNARDAMANGGIITVSTANRVLERHEIKSRDPDGGNEFLCLEVRDQGTGIDSAILDRIFEPFFTTKSAGKGTGLGLSVVHGIIQQHGGWIDVESTPGAGTTFRIFLPRTLRKKAEADDLDQAVDTTESGEIKGILVVEDNELVRHYAERILESSGYKVFTAGDCAQAASILESGAGEIDLILTDTLLPDGSGVDLAEHSTQLYPWITMVLTSGFINSRSVWDYIRQKGYPFLSKPYSSSALLSAIRRQ